MVCECGGHPRCGFGSATEGQGALLSLLQVAAERAAVGLAISAGHG